ncbi:MAG: MauE/DoxX family redox-associated membrane protein [Acidimicrobiia bacterium]
MGAWAGPFLVAALLLVAAGALKTYDPATTTGALRRAGLPVPPVVVRVGGAVEVVIGVAAIATGGPIAAGLVALSYLLFTAFVVLAIVRHLPIGSCGCFGKIDTPPSLVHVVLNVGAIVTATAVALGSGGGIGAVLADQDLLGLPFLLFVATATYLAFLALTALPQLRSLETGRSRA